ncbi:calcineurin catalytic subunit A, putative [Entamoeba histolytica HM-1:IMSS-B]|uniref:Serine/threonine-protein phosphatase n=4 Tax=Entamoeba histolytica TaxID=5759 RepID=C4LTW2_ENTH1|nr:calcineurin catalytic subunit A, putative [Entamoeba histolytica HM-1:IMSS]EAL48796.2 calcineurin catalytic subunit A, putative [Entamoeba histolytica HM-1:IMSS]EMH75764.1 calcineurin catalytic subunit A, putative [Entamoeba histolytica HM-1:IMSS-B]ENY62767.1 serine/threonine protein phosphatase 2B catalytic subunit gamma isoform, putative [Entamoeba histolytica HM-1:IMSS-A]GAT92021.1 calcineurin catalytic subunit a putative [Entamoeba histolytica]|eukprot:XP_654180.2 calcineurin catalytic subunit A, putative [Entamoeba histolytica HM-1:IMSS]
MNYIISLPKTPAGLYDTEALQRHFMHGGIIEEEDVSRLIEESESYFGLEENVIHVYDNVLIFGDYHGQYFDLITQMNDPFWEGRYSTSIYLGDYVDRGTMSCEVLITLLSMKVNNPSHVIMLRGNHESRNMTRSMGFMAECKMKYSLTLYYQFCSLFDSLPLVCVVHRDIGDFFCCHGGISPDMTTINQINSIDRFHEPPLEGLFCDLLWGDPISEKRFEEQPGFKKHYDTITFLPNNERNCSYYFGYKAINEFLQTNNITAVIRGHQCNSEGVEMHFFGSDELEFPLCFTVFSASLYSLNNKSGSLLLSNEKIDIGKYNQPDCLSQYNPILPNPILFSVIKVMESIEDIMYQLISFVFNEEEDEHEEISKVQVSQVQIQQENFKNEACSYFSSTEKELITPLNSYLSQKNRNDEDIIVIEIPEVKTSISRKGKINNVLITFKENIQKKNSLFLSFDQSEVHPLIYNNLHASIATQEPSLYETNETIKRIRQESLPVSIEEIRKKYLGLNK